MQGEISTVQREFRPSIITKTVGALEHESAKAERGRLLMPAGE
ncbi:MAG TPA: hypothetical protein VHY91_22590 [Pirellulales bacterium]|jgi:hypothetical protein|nr:hypothetical protein [Pirellulales bacterium]